MDILEAARFAPRPEPATPEGWMPEMVAVIEAAYAALEITHHAPASRLEHASLRASGEREAEMRASAYELREEADEEARAIARLVARAGAVRIALPEHKGISNADDRLRALCRDCGTPETIKREGIRWAEQVCRIGNDNGLTFGEVV